MNIALNVPFLMLTMISVRHLIGWYSGTGFENMGIQSAKQLEEKTVVESVIFFGFIAWTLTTNQEEKRS